MTIAEDHIHALLSIPPYLSIARVIQALKQWSSRNVGIRWQAGYFVTTVTDDKILTRIKNYILTQRPQADRINDNEATRNEK
jgi:REP element-mobilizing transposase RayT